MASKPEPDSDSQYSSDYDDEHEDFDDEEDDDYFDEVYDERRSRSNPSRATRDNGARREYTEPENELPYESERTARKGNGYTSELEDFDEIE